eukprot:m.333051 g.333051  ORF g.333051 m.333051 type:complete len:884 (+) comp20501_c0_seq2:148-2799(+)
MRNEMQPLLVSNAEVEDDELLGANEEAPRRGTLTTFFGVFVPCVLSIFSVILFLRMGYVLSQVGLILSLGLLVIAYFVVTLTILSISAISTNGVIRGGGAYYMISRTLGPEFGGAIGIIFYFANIFASGLYVVGFVETIIQTADSLSPDRWLSYGLGSAVIFFCLIVCLVGAQAFAKASFAIFLVVMLAVISVFVNFLAQHDLDDLKKAEESTVNETLVYTGFNSHTFRENVYPELQIDYTTGAKQTVSAVFGVLFNGCTGIMAGANMSGDLKDASKSIPRGTLQAAFFTFSVYVLFFILSAATCSRELMLNQYGYLQEINKVPELVMLGVFAATLSAALSTLIGASRILQAISKDKLLGDWFSFFSKERGEPLRAVLLSWFLVQCVLLIGNINTIAPIVSMLFLLSYAITNFACFVLSITGTPNFRPRFRHFSWHTAFLGFASCIVAMFVIEATYAAASVFLFIMCFAFIHFRHIPVSWGDVSQALMYHQVRKYLLRLQAQARKFWRPQILMLVVNPRSSFEKVLFVNEMKKGGLFVLGHVVVDDFGEQSRAQLKKQSAAWHQLDAVAKVKAFVDCTIATSVRLGARSLMLTSGLGGMRPNIVVLGWYKEDAKEDQLVGWRNRLEEKKKKKLIVNLTRVHEVDGLMDHFEPMTVSRGDNRHKIQHNEYIGIIQDALALGKNVCVIRNFSQMPELSARAKHDAKNNLDTWYIDLWPLLFSPGGPAQHSYEMILQLGSIVQKVRRWEKYTTLRVCHFVERGENLQSERDRLEALLNDLRVSAEIKVVALESQPGEPEPTDSPLNALVDLTNVAASKHMQYLGAMIAKNSENTCCVFTYLPPPPAEDVLDAERYLALLDGLSHQLPPVVMCQGVEKVVTSNEHSV